MAEVHFGFTTEMEDKILQGKKLCTTRINKKRQKDDVLPPKEPRCKAGDYFVLHGNKFQIVSVKTRTIQDVRVSFLDEEGFEPVKDESGKIVKTAVDQMVELFTGMGYPPDSWGRPCVVYFFAHVLAD